MKSEKGIASHTDPKHRRPWEPMALVPVGNLAVVIQDKSGSFTDGMGGFKKTP